MRKIIPLLTFTLLASCTVGPDYHRPQLYTDQSIAQSLKTNPNRARATSADWYRQFNDPVLNDLITETMRGNPDLNSALHNLRKARYSLSVNAVQYLPMFNADGSYHYSQNSENRGFTVKEDYYQAGLDASWELDIWGTGRRLTESETALYKAAGANFDNVIVSLTAETANNYIQLRAAQEQLRIAQENLKLQTDIYDLVKTKYDNGLADDIALNQSRYAVEQTKTLIPQLETNIEAYENALAILTGRLPGSLNHMLANHSGNLVRQRFAYDLNRLYELPVDVIRNRPDVQIAEQQLVAQNALVGKAVADLYPSVSLSGFLGFQAKNVSSLFNNNSFLYTFTPGMTIPVFNWGELINTVHMQEETTKEAFYAYQQSVLKASGEIRNAMVGITKEYDKNSAARKSVASQQEIISLQLFKYKEGLINFNDILTAEQDLLKSQNELIASNGAIYQNIIAFYKATVPGTAVDIIGGRFDNSCAAGIPFNGGTDTPRPCPRQSI